MSGKMHLPTLERLTGVSRSIGRTRDLEASLRVLSRNTGPRVRENDRIRILRRALHALADGSRDHAGGGDAGRQDRTPQILDQQGAGSRRTFVRRGPGDDPAEPGQGRALSGAGPHPERPADPGEPAAAHPDDPRVQKKIEKFQNAPTLVTDAVIPEVVEETARKEIDIIGAPPKPAPAKATVVSRSGPGKAPAPAVSTAPPPNLPAQRPLKTGAAGEPAEPVGQPIPPAPVQHLDLESLISDISPRPAGPPNPPTARIHAASRPVRGSSRSSGRGRRATRSAGFPAGPAEKRNPGIFRQERSSGAVAGSARTPSRPEKILRPRSVRPKGSRRWLQDHGRRDFRRTGHRPLCRRRPRRRSPSPGYIDIADKIEEEIEALEAEFYKQIKERTSVIEKDLVEIVQEFRRQVDIKLDQQNYESRYNLGVAFLEQKLYEEAIAEFELAAADPARAADCWGLIGQCYVKKRNYPEARRCFEGAISLTAEESPERFALAYELASLYEMMSENEAALALYREVSGWSPKFRNTAKRIKILEKIVS